MVCGLSHVALVTCNKVLTLREKKRLVTDYLIVRLNLLTDLPSQVRGLKLRIKTFHFTLVLFNIKIKAKLVGADPNLRGYSNYLPLTRETTKLASSDQMRYSHCS